MKPLILGLLMCTIIVFSVSATDNFNISNLGVTGLDQSNPEYTSQQAVFLNMVFNQTAANCRYTNYDHSYQPKFSYIGWSNWEDCISQRAWELSDGQGLKYVYYQINYSGTFPVLNDSIYYIISGEGLDTTPPSAVSLIYDNYSNSGGALQVRWTLSYDAESVVLGLPIKYDYTFFTGNQDYPGGSVLFFPFEAGSTASYTPDLSGYGNDGTVAGAYFNTSARGYNSAYDFDGTDKIDAGSDSSLDITSNLTLTFWMKRGGTGNQVIIAKRQTSGHGTYQVHQSTNYINFQVSDDGTTNPGHYLIATIDIADVPIGEWHYIAATYNNFNSGFVTLRIFLDGELKGSFGGTVFPINSEPTVPVTIGAFADDSYPFTGSLDNIRIYDRALNYSEILLDYDAGMGILDSGTTESLVKTSTGLALKDGAIVYMNVTARNSANITNTTTSYPDGIIIDLTDPMIELSANFTNLTDGNNYPVPSSQYIRPEAITFNWTGSDNISYTDEYSYVFTNSPSAAVDEVPEGSLGHFQDALRQTYSSLTTGIFYFSIKARDAAGNWMSTPETMQVNIDLTPPSKPVITSETRTYYGLRYTWSDSSDKQSGLDYYMINLTDGNGALVNSTITNATEHTFNVSSTGEYHAIVGAKDNVGNWIWSTEEQVVTDFEPPVIIALPNQTTATLSPILKVWTDEQATCYYNTSGVSLTKFRYTNDTYHETKSTASFINGQTVYFTITCADGSLNTADQTISFKVDDTKVPSTATVGQDFSVYEGTYVTIKEYVSDMSGYKIAGLDKDNFQITIDGDAVQLSVFDMGDGSYNLTFEAPEVGTHQYRMTIGGWTSTHTLTVKKVSLGAFYRESTALVPSRTDHIDYFTDSGYIFGIASDTVSPDIEVPTTYRLNISDIDHDDHVLIFNSNASGRITSKESLLDKRDFLDKYSPTFGYQTDDVIFTNIVIYSKEFNIISEVGDELKRGDYRFLLKNRFSDTGKKEVIFSYGQ